MGYNEGGALADVNLYGTLPLVASLSSLLGKPPPTTTALPLAEDLVDEAIASVAGTVSVVHLENGGAAVRTGNTDSFAFSHVTTRVEKVQYVQRAGGYWEHRFPLHLHASLLPLKLEGFRDHWQAQMRSEDERTFVFQIVPSLARSRGPARSQPRVGLEMDVQVTSASNDLCLTEVIVGLKLFGGPDAPTAQKLRDLVPRLFQSLRAYLLASAEQRAQQRFPFPNRLRIYSIKPDLELTGVVEGQGRNISRSGMSLVSTTAFPTEFVYLHLQTSANLSTYVLLARVVRVEQTDEGHFDVGVTFQVDEPPKN
jgi:hypothetical protein